MSDKSPAPGTHLRVTDEMILAGCIAAYGEGFADWPKRSKDDGVSMVSKVINASLAGTQGAQKCDFRGLALELLQALCGELRLNRGTHQDLINRARAELSTPSPASMDAALSTPSDSEEV